MAIVHAEQGGFIALHALPNGNTIASSVESSEISHVIRQEIFQILTHLH